MEQNKQKNSRKRLNSLILLVAFTAVMLILSTYAWFSTQKNVTLGGLKGEVNVAEGLQISLNAEDWKNEIDLSETGIAEYFSRANTNYGLTTDEAKFSLAQPYALTWDDTTPATYHKNTIPSELLPASTIGSDSIGDSSTDMKLYRGENTDAIVLSDIHEIGSSGYENEEKGYYAIDFFLQNSSSAAAIEGNINDILYLEKNSTVTLESTDKYISGLQNSLRVAFVLYDNGDDGLPVDGNTNQSDIISGTNGENIIDVAIWEPNATGTAGDSIYDQAAHVDYILTNNNRIVWSVADASTYLSKTLTQAGQANFAADTKLPTYALTSTSVSATYTSGDSSVSGIKNIYDWANTTTTGLTKQNAVQTSVAGISEAVKLVSATNGTTDFSIAPGQYHKLRMYVWLEGQDIDCINWASLGGDITLDIGLSKPGTNTSDSTSTSDSASV